MKENKLYLTTGEFAKLCHTSKHTLFHYYDIELFTPAYIDENGYRYYHVLQYDSFLTITQLRTIGMSLAEIKNYMEERSPEHMVNLYTQQEQILSKKISELKQIKERMSSQKNNILKSMNCTDEFFQEKQKKSFLLCSEIIKQPDDSLMTNAIGNLIYRADGKTSSNALGMICKVEDAIRLENCPCQFYVYTSSSKSKDCVLKAEGNYLNMYHHGDYETLTLSYRKIVLYAEKHHLETEGEIYAETVVGDWAVRCPEDYIIKVSVKIK